MKTDNELIAEFMGGVREHPSKHQYYGHGWGDHVWAGLPNVTVTPLLHYDTSWDWLMPVVEKCKCLQTGKWHHKSQLLFVDITIALDNVNIELVYKAVVEFIKWYNNEIH